MPELYSSFIPAAQFKMAKSGASTASQKDCEMMDSDDSEDFDSWKDTLQSYRMHLVERVQYRTLYPALLSYLVIDSEDHEELSNPYTLRTEKMRLNHLVDVLLRKGEQSYKKFLDILSRYYPVVYKEVTGIEPQVQQQEEGEGSSKIDESTVQLLTQALDNLAQDKIELARKIKRLGRALEDKNSDYEQLRQAKEDLQLRVELYNAVDNELTSLRKEADRLKTDNYSVCMLMIDVKNENADLRESNIKLKNDIDKITMEKQKLESCVKLERSQSVRLRNKLQHSLSVYEVMEMKQEIDELKLKLAQANSQNPIQNDNIDMRIQILQRDKDEAIEMYAEALQNLNRIREDCANAENLRDKYLEEKEQLELSVTVLHSDCEMFKLRRDTMWQQLQEVEKEREMLMRERNDAQQLAKACMEEKTQYRQQIRHHQEQYDKQAKQLLEAKRDILSLKSASRPRNTSLELLYNARPQNAESLDTSTGSTASIVNHSTTSSEADGSMRRRAFNTKYYEQFLSDDMKDMSRSVKDLTYELDNGLKNVFPEIELAANYGPRDSGQGSFSPPCGRSSSSPTCFSAQGSKDLLKRSTLKTYTREKHRVVHHHRPHAYSTGRDRNSSGTTSTSPSPSSEN